MKETTPVADANAVFNCNVCHAGRLLFVFEAHSPDFAVESYKIFRCCGCGVYSTGYRMEKNDYQKYYFSGYYGDYPGIVKGILGFFNGLFLADRVRKITALQPLKGRLLDYGAGNGEFLYKMGENGWEILGVEPSRAESDAVIRRNIGEIDAKEKMDIVTLWHVAEHFNDPADEIAEISRLLKDGGILFVCVPNMDSWEAKLGKGKWFHLDVPRHVYHFTPGSIIKLLANCGFQVIRVNYFSIFYNTFGTFQTLFNRMGFEINFFYNVFKRGKDYRKAISCGKLVFNGIMHFVLFIPVVAVSFAMSVISSLFGKSGTMEIVCKKMK